jgi:hypothetical protein
MKTSLIAAPHRKLAEGDRTARLANQNNIALAFSEVTGGGDLKTNNHRFTTTKKRRSRRMDIHGKLW